MSDPLLEVIQEAGREWWGSGAVGVTLAGHQAEAVKAHIARMLDAEEAFWRTSKTENVHPCINRLRASLLGTTEPASAWRHIDPDMDTRNRAEQ